MRIHKPLSKILDGGLKVDILRLFCRTGKEMSGREIARELKATAPTTNLALKDLSNEKVIFMRVIGKMHLYSLNRDTWVTKSLLKPLFIEERKLPDRLIQVIKTHFNESGYKDLILSFCIFGSFVRKEEKPSSDIDIFAVVKDAGSKKVIEDLIFKLDEKLIKETGLALEPHVYSLLEFKKRVRDKMPFVVDVLESNQLLLGKDLKGLI